jgi:hypothetical protein
MICILKICTFSIRFLKPLTAGELMKSFNPSLLVLAAVVAFMAAAMNPPTQLYFRSPRLCDLHVNTELALVSLASTEQRSPESSIIDFT